MEGNNLLADAAARKLAERNAAQTTGAKIGRFFAGCWNVCKGAWNGTPSAIRALFAFAIWSVALGFLCVMTYWELTNSGSGYALIFAGWGGVAWLAGVSVAGFYMFSHRQHKQSEQEREELDEREVEAIRLNNAVALDEVRRRKKKNGRDRRRWQISTIVCALVTIFGVFSNLVSHASMDMAHAMEVEEDRAEIRREVSRLKRELGVMPKPEGVEFTRETLAAYEAEAVGWKMENLAPDGACLADLKKRQRELCNLAADIRAELLEAEEMQKAVDAKAEEIRLAEIRLEEKKPIAGAKHYERMADLVLSIPGVPATWERGGVANGIQVWGILALALAGLWICAAGWNAVGEKLESLRKPKTIAG